MARLSSLDQIEQLYAERGGLNYGEGVSQLEHALQCAALAEAEGVSPSLVVAALLHDIGHLFESEADAVARDLRHEAAGAEALSLLFGEEVCAPIALHVEAKRYLCFTEPVYFDALSRASKASLEFQGGPFRPVEAAAFEARPHWRQAIALRRYDDTGKRQIPALRAFEDYLPLMHGLLVRGA